MALQLGHCLPIWVLGWKAVCWPNHASDVVSLVSIFLSKGLVERTWAEADCLEGSLSCLMVEFDLLTGFPVNGLWFVQLFSIWKDEVWDSWPQAENLLSIDVFDCLSYIVGFFFLLLHILVRQVFLKVHFKKRNGAELLSFPGRCSSSHS